MQNFHQKIKENVKSIFIQKTVTPVINIFITIYIVKKLSVVEYGIYNLLYALIGYLTLFTSMGLLNAFQRFIPEYYTREHYSKIKQLFNYSLLLRFILTVVSLILLLQFSDALNQLFKTKDLAEYIQLFSIGIVLFLEIQLVEVTLNSMLFNKYVMISYLLATLFRAGVTYWLLEMGMRLKGLFLAETAYFGLLLILQLGFYIIFFVSRHSSAKTKLSFKRIIRYCGFSYLDEIGWTILDVKTDFFIISSFLGPGLVGIYAFANQLIESVSKIMPFKIIRPIIHSVFFSKYSQDDSADRLNRHFNFLTKIIAFISFPVFMGVFVYADKIITCLFDPKYLPARTIVWIFAGFMMIISFQFPLQLVVQALEKVEITFYSKIFSIYNLVGDLLVVNWLGILGVALITCSARLFQFVFVFYRIKKHIALQVEMNSLIKIFINSLVMVSGLYLLRNLVYNALTLILFSAAGAIFYLMISVVNKSFFSEERDIINKLLPRPIFVF